MNVMSDPEVSRAIMPSSSLALGKSGLLMFIVCCLLAIIFIKFVTKLYHVRREFRSLQRQGLPMPPHHLLFGHIPLLAGIVGSLPKRAAHGYLGDQVRRRYPDLDEAFYLDLWPLAPRVLVVMSPDMMHQYSQDRYLPKHPTVEKFLGRVVGRYNLVSMEGSLWKQWRAKFNPGFSAGQIMSSIPGIVDEVVIFRDLLRERANKNEILQLEELALNLSFDVIGRVVMGHEFNSQRAENSMASALRRQVEWTKFGIDPSPLEQVNILRPVVQWYNTRAMNSYLSHHLNLRYSNIRIDDIKDKSIVDLAIKSHHVSNPPITGKTTAVTSPMNDTEFKELLMTQIKIILFAGHDTTAASAVYMYHLLSRHPSILARVQEEHNSVFGPDITALPTILASNPYILNELPYTLAFIKETLRFFAPISSIRAGQPDFFLSSPRHSTRFPTENCLVWSNHQALHCNPRYWVRPEEFLPERWLVSECDPLYPIKDGWRPFERGPRSCIGQELAIAELKVILALTVREFRIEDAYREWDLQKGTAKRERAGVNGERAYQFIRGGGHPSEFYPCRVKSLFS